MSDACETAYLCLIFSEETGWFNELWLFIALLVYSVVVHIFQVPEMPHNITGLPKTNRVITGLPKTNRVITGLPKTNRALLKSPFMCH